MAGTGGSSPKPPDLWGIPRDRPASSPSETLFGCDARGAPPADERLPRGPNPRARLGLRHRPIQPRRTILIIGYLTATLVGTIGGGLTLTGLAADVGAAAVPEPAGLVLLGTGAVGLLSYAARRTRPRAGG